MDGKPNNKSINDTINKSININDPITSTISNPDFGSELSLMANFINFNVTIEAFEAQVLSMLLAS